MNVNPLAILLLFCTILIAIGSCDSQVADTPEASNSIAAFDLESIPRFATPAEKANPSFSVANPGYFTCVVSTLLAPDGPDNYRYNTYKVKLPKQFKDKNNPTRRKIFIYGSRYVPDYAQKVSGIGGITRVARCQIPDNPDIIDWLDKRFETFGSDSWLGQRKNDPFNKTSDSIQERIVCDDWQIAIACVEDPDTGEQTCGIKSITCTNWHIEEEGPGGGGPGGGTDDDGPGGGTPGPGGDPCEPCDPTMPCDNQGGGGTPTGCEPEGGSSPPIPDDPCEFENPPPEANCDVDPCQGDVIENPEIAPSGGWNEWGGQFGYTRNSGNTFHDGTDIRVHINSKLGAMHGGEVTDIRDTFDPGEYKPDSYGNYVRIKSTINGDVVYLRYNHLNTVDVEVGDIVSAGHVIGKSGDTGNAQTKGSVTVIPHVHIRARKVVNGQETRVDPENYMATTFNNDGSIDESESDCNKFIN